MSNSFRSALVSEKSGQANEDRGIILTNSAFSLLIIADGAGGTSGGANAAEMLIAFIKKLTLRSEKPLSINELCNALYNIDRLLFQDSFAGETTGVIVQISDETITGASVGDSSAWQIEHSTYFDLTQNQSRKPLLGSGKAIPVAFGPIKLGSKILLASDGLIKYMNPALLTKIVSENNLETANKLLIQSVQLKSGNLQDDTTIILCEKTENHM